MRVIGGRYKNRLLASAKHLEMRPVMDRVKTHVFDVLSGRVAGARVCDLFAGSGSLGIEALSRGAVHVDFVDTARHALALIRRNLESLGVSESYALHRKDAWSFVQRPATAYRLVFCDPPYGYGRHAEIVKLILDSGMLSAEGVLVVEHPAGQEWIGGGEPVRCKAFGRTVISLFEKSVEV